MSVTARRFDDLDESCLITDLANRTSNKVYQAIGFEPVCDVDLYRFAGNA